MRMHTFAPPGTNLRPRLERNDRGAASSSPACKGTARHSAGRSPSSRWTSMTTSSASRTDGGGRGNLIDGGPDSIDALD